ncbi:glycoside hydrolase family 93 protein [Amniculicola lignicola CBS 123094]|uniref:Glycoside hydrolase family 93 protein n=1 Tax=Amniculicola lignicola CBS 123094 TaxID=1392246 RepID=A0A6A5X1V0_9PLEO|nr:glycoside hydrolase family 93 protein [Amniculicola lignicola CBS 123094]
MCLISNLVAATIILLPFATAITAPTLTGPAIPLGTGTYPRLTKLSDGSLLAIYTDSRSGNHTLGVSKSTNNGASFSPISIVDTGPSTSRDIDNGFLHQLPGGKVLAAFRNHNGPVGGPFTFYRITICISSDLGKSWTYLSTPAGDPQGPGGKTGIWEPFLEDALDGSLQLYYSRENNDDDQDSLLRRSKDGGATWTSAQTISGAELTNARDGMLGVARIAANSQSKLAVFESGVAGRFTIHTVRSDNDGLSWPVSSRSTVYEPPAGKSAGSPQIVRVGSRLVASFGTNEDGGVWPEGAMKVVVSEDQGRTWGAKTQIHPLPAMWSGMLEIDATSFWAVYETGGVSFAQKMRF